MNKVWVVMGYASRPDLTERSIQVLLENSDSINLILINNGSKDGPVAIKGPRMTDGSLNYSMLRRAVFINNPVNTGCLPMLRQTIPYMEDDEDILVFIHNDVLIWEPHWDTIVRNAFNEIPDLGLAGLFGAPGVGPDGGRMFARSRMEGREWGTPGEPHGAIAELNEVSPASVLDSLCMMFKVGALRDVEIPLEWPPHHWFDRLFCLRFIDKGYKVAVIGIPFDHYGGGSSGPIMDSFAQKYAFDKTGTMYDPIKANDILYTEGAVIFNHEYAHRLPLVTDGWNYIWRISYS